MAPKRKRALVTQLDEDQLYEDWKVLAEQKKNHRWLWNGKGYSKSSRNCGPDRESLAMHAEPLLAFARLGHTGSVHQKTKILESR